MPSNHNGYGEQTAIPYNPEPYPYPTQPSPYSAEGYAATAGGYIQSTLELKEYSIQVTDNLFINVKADRIGSDYNTGALNFYRGHRVVASFMKWIYYVELEDDSATE